MVYSSFKEQRNWGIQFSTGNTCVGVYSFLEGTQELGYIVSYRELIYVRYIVSLKEHTSFDISQLQGTYGFRYILSYRECMCQVIYFPIGNTCWGIYFPLRNKVVRVCSFFLVCIYEQLTVFQLISNFACCQKMKFQYEYLQCRSYIFFIDVKVEIVLT